MRVIESLDLIPPQIKPVVLTIGNFDGMHLGHQTILDHVLALAKKNLHESAIITFKNHPSVILRPNHPIPLLTSYPHKLKLLEEKGFDTVLPLEFTLEFSKQSAEEFLRKVYNKLPFQHLILGYDAKLGNDRQGNTPLLHKLAHELHFGLEFLPAEMAEDAPISSSRIRHAIQNEDLKGAERLLGRKYSLIGKVIHGQGLGHNLGYPTANISLQGLCYPPFGVYIVTVLYQGKSLPAVANLGYAPTLRHDHHPLLEVHLLDRQLNLYDQNIEVIFEEFLRPEKTFTSKEALQAQIGEDVKAAKEWFL